MEYVLPATDTCRISGASGFATVSSRCGSSGGSADPAWDELKDISLMILHRFCEKVSVHPGRMLLMRRASFSAHGLRFVAETGHDPQSPGRVNPRRPVNSQIKRKSSRWAEVVPKSNRYAP